MPTLKSSKKRLRQNVRAAARNKAARTQLRSTIKKLRTAESKHAAESMLPETVSVIDRSSRKGIIHERAAARYKSNLAHYVNALEA